MLSPIFLLVLVGLLVIVACGLVWALLKTQDKSKSAELRVRELEQRYRPILDVDEAIAARMLECENEIGARTRQCDAIIRDAETAVAERKREHELICQDIDALKADYASKRQTFDALRHELHMLEGRVELAELGLCEPTFEFGTSAEYAQALKSNRERQKGMISAGTAVVCDKKWTVDGSVKAGQTMTNRNIRMTLRAFNNECEVVIGKVNWKNLEISRERIEKSAAALDKLNESNAVYIKDDYIRLKMEELRLTHEERLRKQEEAEQLREERAAAREEERAQREIEAEIRRAGKEETQKREALAKAEAELQTATGAEREKLQARIAELEQKLTEAEQAKQRAVSMAEQTRAGHVYVISNIGSFGQEVFKVGMTRRIDPMERVRELGDASVPFPFDVHALIFTEDAPGLERELQTALQDYRVNRVNPRKEFFRISRTEVQRIIERRFPDLPFLEQPDAQEYFSSLPKERVEELVHTLEDAKFPAFL